MFWLHFHLEKKNYILSAVTNDYISMSFTIWSTAAASVLSNCNYKTPTVIIYLIRYSWCARHVHRRDNYGLMFIDRSLVQNLKAIRKIQTTRV